MMEAGEDLGKRPVVTGEVTDFVHPGTHQMVDFRPGWRLHSTGEGGDLATAEVARCLIRPGVGVRCDGPRRSQRDVVDFADFLEGEQISVVVGAGFEDL